jgi:hypothetical protein
MSSELATVEHGALAREQDLGIPVEQLVARVKKIKAVQASVMQRDHHYGLIPGVNKPTLLKPGAEVLCLTFQLAPEFRLEERWDGDHLEVVAHCVLTHAPSGTKVGSGIGSCSTKETKYAYRKGERLCPNCSKPTIIKGKAEYGGGWVCFTKKGGCGAKFKDGDQAIEGQSADRVANPDLPDTYNTVRKMACKRALVAAVLIVTCASELFTQDVEDMPHDEEQPSRAHAQSRANAPKPAPAASPLQGVPTSQDLEKTLAEIAAIPTMEGLVAHAQANRAKRWSKTQVEALKQASADRKAQLESSEYRDEGDGEPGEEIPF